MSEVGGVSLVELRRLYGEGDLSLPPPVRAALRDDSRRGARELGRRLARRRSRAATEKLRLRELFRMERALQLEGLSRVAGVDEVGMGPLAGPVVAAAVVLPRRLVLLGLDDSKRVRRAERERLALQIRSLAREVSVGVASREEIDRLNIYHAGLLAMRRALLGLESKPDIALVDGRRVPALDLEQRAVIGGDGRVACIAAASIVAKVHRDRLMAALEDDYPGYGFAHNAGYATAHHLRVLAERGPTPAHRRSFTPVRQAALRHGSV